MKFFFLLSTVVCLAIPFPRVNAQLTVAIAAMDAITIAQYAAQVKYWKDQLDDMAESIK